jgi:hypothetical protein
MSQQSGFVSIRFRLAGKLLLAAGFIGLSLAGIGALSGWFELPSMILYMSLAAIPISIYIIIVSPVEN